MGVIELLSSDNYIIVNKTIAHEIGLNEAILLGELASEYKFWKNNNELVDGDLFYSKIENIEENTTLTGKQQRTAIKNLMDKDIISVKVKGLPAKRYFKINELKIFEILEKGCCPKGITSCAKREQLDVPKGNTNNNKEINNKEENILKEETFVEETKFDTNEINFEIGNKVSFNNSNFDTNEITNTPYSNVDFSLKESSSVGSTAPTEQKVAPPAVSDLFAFWKENNLKGREATQGAIKATMKALKAYSVEEIKVAIKHYAICLHDNSYYFNYPWSMEQFMARREAIPHFLEDGDIWQDYENKHGCIKVKATVEDYEKIINEQEQEKYDGRSQL